MTAAIWWIRRNMRLTDNSALRLALENRAANYPPVHPRSCFCFQSKQNSGKPSFSKGLRQLDADLKTTR